MRIVLFVALLTGCTKTDPATVQPDSSTKRPDTSAATESAASAPTVSEKVRCVADGDCVVSCALGAVNGAWWTAWDKSDECKDGCMKRNRGVCRDGRCVAVNRSSGVVDPSCTKSP